MYTVALRTVLGLLTKIFKFPSMPQYGCKDAKEKPKSGIYLKETTYVPQTNMKAMLKNLIIMTLVRISGG